MDARRRRLFLRWLQSDRAELLVDAPPDREGVVPIPRDFLRQRSRRFRELLDRADWGSDSDQLQLESIALKTIEDFLIWSHSLVPRIDENASFEDTVNLGIFALKYQIPALSNQVTDQIRQNLAKSQWQLNAAIVDAIYAAASAGTPLREVVRAALGQLPKPLGDEWKPTFIKHSHLGWDYPKAVETAWSPEEYLVDICRFHDHEDHVTKVTPGRQGEKCPHAEQECYPIGDEDEDQDTDAVPGLHETPEPTESGSTVVANGSEAPDESGVPEEYIDEPKDQVEPAAPEEPAAEEVPLTEPEHEPTTEVEMDDNSVRVETDSVADMDARTVLSEETNEEANGSITELVLDDAAPPTEDVCSEPVKSPAIETVTETPPLEAEKLTKAQRRRMMRKKLGKA